MIQPTPTPRPGLFTNMDADAWAEQFHTLFYVLHMDAAQVAQIDYGCDPDDPMAFMVFAWADEIYSRFPKIDVAAMIGACR